MHKIHPSCVNNRNTGEIASFDRQQRIDVNNDNNTTTESIDVTSIGTAVGGEGGGVNTNNNNHNADTISTSSANAELAALFECPVCFDFALPPIMQCQSGHIVCSQCRSQLNSCPTCRGPLDNIRNLAMEKLAANVLFPCKYISNGCTESLSCSQKPIHEDICEYRPYSCPCPGASCKWFGSLDQVLNHLLIQHKSITTLQGEDIVFLATDINLPGAVDWVMMQSCFGYNFMLVLEKQDRHVVVGGSSGNNNSNASTNGNAINTATVGPLGHHNSAAAVVSNAVNSRRLLPRGGGAAAAGGVGGGGANTNTTSTTSTTAPGGQHQHVGGVLPNTQIQQFYAIVQLIGTHKQAEQFIYRLELNAPRKRLTWEATPRSIHDGVQAAITRSDCLVFDSQVANLFADNGNLGINVTINQSCPSSSSPSNKSTASQ